MFQNIKEEYPNRKIEIINNIKNIEINLIFSFVLVFFINNTKIESITKKLLNINTTFL